MAAILTDEHLERLTTFRVRAMAECLRQMVEDGSYNKLTTDECLIELINAEDDAADGTIKKHHYHVVIMSDGPITQKRANEILEPFCGTKSAERILSIKGYARYLAHLDDPDKAQYNPTEIIALGGADLVDLLKPSRSDRFQFLGEMIDFCEEYCIFEFCHLLQYARRERPADWFPILTENAYLMSRYLTSLRYVAMDEQKEVYKAAIKQERKAEELKSK